MATLATGDGRIDLARAEDFDLGRARVRPSLLEIAYGNTSQLVEPRVMQMLVALHRGSAGAISREDLIGNCWSGLAVSDDAITQCVSKLRRALANVPDVQVVSVPRVGYRLVAAPGGEPASAGPRNGLGRRAIITGGICAGIAAGVGGGIILNRGANFGGDSIAVLPFANLSNDPDQAYLSDGIAEEVRNALAHVPGLKVVGRTSSEAVRNMDTTSAAHRLNVSEVLIGSVRRSATTIRVAAQLVDGRTGLERWSKTYDLAPGDALRIQSEIAEGVALALRAKLGRFDQVAQIAGGTRNALANDLYLQAKLALRLNDSEATFRKVIALCEGATGIDAAFGAAYALKGIAWDALASSFATDAMALAQDYEQGAIAGRKAIALAPRMAAGYVALARSMSGRLKVRAAFELYRRAEPLAGADPGIVSWWILTLAEIGRTSEALSLSERLISLDPLNPDVFERQAFAHFFARQYAPAIRSATKAMTLAPGLTEPPGLIGDCLCLLGRYSQAASQYEKVPPLNPYRLTGEAFIAARTGDRAGCERILAHLRRSYGDPISYQVAQIYAQLGKVEEAFAALERGRSALDPGLNGLPADPFVDPLRKDARFKRLLQSLDLG